MDPCRVSGRLGGWDGLALSPDSELADGAGFRGRDCCECGGGRMARSEGFPAGSRTWIVDPAAVRGHQGAGRGRLEADWRDRRLPGTVETYPGAARINAGGRRDGVGVDHLQ